MNLNRIAQQQERLMLNTFNAIISDIKEQAVISEIVRALEVGNVDAVIELLQLDESTWEPLSESIRQAYRQGGITGAAQIGAIPVDEGTLVLRFNTRNPRAEEWLATRSSRLITEIVQDQRDMVRATLTANLAQGVNPRTSALDLVGRIDAGTKKRTGGFIGLTSQQAQWSVNARTQLENLDPAYFDRALRDKRLDSKIAKAMASGEVLDAKTIDAAVTRMQQRTLKYRADVIARTESINALRAGHHESIAQAIELGELESGDVMKEFDASMDARTRETHAEADGQLVPFDQPFEVGGYQMQHPGDSSLGAPASEVISCRCREKIEIRFGKRLKRIEGFR